MPLVRISLLKGKPCPYVRAIGDGVHKALAETFGVPPDDHFQVVEQLEREDLVYDAGYLGMQRTDDVVFITIIASADRDTSQKKALFRAVAANLAENPGLRPEDVIVVLSPNTREDWSFGNGLASYAKD